MQVDVGGPDIEGPKVDIEGPEIKIGLRFNVHNQLKKQGGQEKVIVPKLPAKPIHIYLQEDDSYGKKSSYSQPQQSSYQQPQVSSYQPQQTTYVQPQQSYGQQDVSFGQPQIAFGEAQRSSSEESGGQQTFFEPQRSSGSYDRQPQYSTSQVWGAPSKSRY